MATTFPAVASVTSESFTPFQALAADHQVTTQLATIASGAGVLSYLQVLGKITASGKLTVHNPGASDGSQVAVALATGAFDATSADVNCPVITEGVFAMQALTYHSSVTTDAAKLATFPIGSNIVIKKLAFGAV